MGETQTTRHPRVEKYDPLKGRFIRDMKVTDIVNIFKKGSPTSNDTVSWDMVTYTTDAYVELFPYIVHGHHHGTATSPQFLIYGPNSTTALAFQCDQYGEGYTIVTDCNCPLMRVAPSSTITITALNATNTTDTYCAWIVAKKEPTLSIVEDA